MFRTTFTLLFFLSFYFELRASINVELEDAAPNYNRLQTIVRLNNAEGINAVCFKDYKGMEVMFETRDSVTKRLAWAGKVSFRPEKEKASPVYELDSQVIISYLAHPSYFEENRNYSTVDYGYIANEEDRPLNIDEAGAPIAHPRSPLIIHNLPYTYRDSIITSHYKNWLQNSIFEWTLNHVYTIRDLQNTLESLMIGRKFPKYLLYGYSSDGGCLNCVTFPSALLERVGVNVRLSSTIDSYLRDYLNRTWWGTTTLGLRIVTTGGGVLFGGAVGFLAVQEAIKDGAIAGGVVAGPVGAVVGAVVVGGVVGVVTYGAKGLLDRQSNVRNAATRELLTEEIYNNRTQLNLRIVKTRRNGGIQPPLFNDVGILDILNRKKYWFQTKLTNFPAGCNFAEYGFNY